MATKARTLHRELTAAWLAAGVLVLALAVVPVPGHQGMQRSVAAVVEATLTPLAQRAAAMFHLEPLRPGVIDALDDSVASKDGYRAAD